MKALPDKLLTLILLPVRMVQRAIGNFKQEIQDKINAILGNFLMLLSIVIVVLISLLFASAGLGLYLNEVLESNYLGFFLVAIFYLFLAAVLSIVKKNKAAKGNFTNRVKRILEIEYTPKK